MFRRKKKEPPRALRPDGPLFRCSFCNKDQDHVARLIAGPNVRICNECVDICVDVLQAPQSGESKRAHVSRDSFDHPILCSICRQEAPVATALAVQERGFLCPDCAAAVQAALASHQPN